jgi:hypothetical protein
MLVARGGVREMTWNVSVRHPMRGTKDKSKRARSGTTVVYLCRAGRRFLRERRASIPSHNIYKEQIHSC